jgi:hypothetical protein
VRNGCRIPFDCLVVQRLGVVPPLRQQPRKTTCFFAVAVQCATATAPKHVGLEPSGLARDLNSIVDSLLPFLHHQTPATVLGTPKAAGLLHDIRVAAIDSKCKLGHGQPRIALASRSPNVHDVRNTPANSSSQFWRVQHPPSHSLWPCDRLPAYLRSRSTNGTTTTPTTSAVLEAHIHPFNVTQLHISIPSQGQSPPIGHRCKSTHSHSPSRLPVPRFLSRLLPRCDGKWCFLTEFVSVRIPLGSSPITEVSIDAIEHIVAGGYEYMSHLVGFVPNTRP